VFISTDPVEQYWNLYSYCGGDPINLIDPDGQLAANVIGKIIGTAVGLTAGGIIGGLYAKNHGMDAINGIFPGMMIGGFAGFTAGAGIGYGIESGFFNQLGSVLTYGGSLSRYRDIWNAVNTASSIISAAQVASSADANDVSPQMLTPGYPGEMGGGNASSGGTNVGLAMGSLGMAGQNIVDQGGVNIRHFGTGADHGPAHAHVTGQGPNTRIGPQGFPLKGDPPLSAAQRSIVQKNLKIIRKTLNKLGSAFQAIDRATPKMIWTPIITEQQLYNIQHNLPLDMESEL